MGQLLRGERGKMEGRGRGGREREGKRRGSEGRGKEGPGPPNIVV